MSEEPIFSRRVLIADDERPNVMLLEKILARAGYSQVCGTSDGRDVLPLYVEFEPDVLLLDLHMPGMSGFEVMEHLRAIIGRRNWFPILVLTADTTIETRQRALSGGASDFVTKPFDQIEVLLRMRNLLQTQSLHRELEEHNRTLEARVRERTSDLEDARIEVLERLSLAADFRDDETGQHAERVGRTAALLAQALWLPDAEVEAIRRAAPLHDVGKIGVPDAVLLKPGRLTAEEFRLMQTHTVIGGRILKRSRSPILQMAERIAMTHHECWNGGGYPLGLRGDEIPLSGQAVSVADVFDALTHSRPYKSAWPVDQAAAEIERLSGAKFDPRVVAAFCEVFNQGLLASNRLSETVPSPTQPVHALPPEVKENFQS